MSRDFSLDKLDNNKSERSLAPKFGQKILSAGFFFGGEGAIPPLPFPASYDPGL